MKKKYRYSILYILCSESGAVMTIDYPISRKDAAEASFDLAGWGPGEAPDEVNEKLDKATREGYSISNWHLVRTEDKLECRVRVVTHDGHIDDQPFSTPDTDSAVDPGLPVDLKTKDASYYAIGKVVNSFDGVVEKKLVKLPATSLAEASAKAKELVPSIMTEVYGVFAWEAADIFRPIHEINND